MLTWLVDRISAPGIPGPLGSAKAARALLTELEPETSLYGLTELARHFKDTPAEAFGTRGCVDALHAMDEWAQQRLDELWGTVIIDRQGIALSMPVWEALTQYYREAYVGYWNCHQAGAASASTPKRDSTRSTLIAARALAAATRLMLLLRMRYLVAPAETWSHLWGLIGRTDEWGSAAEEVALYPEGPRTTVERELLTAMVFAVAPTGNLLPGQILALEHLLRLHAREYRRSPRYDSRETPFVYEPSRSAPPERWFSRVDVRAELRYFGVGKAYDKLCEVRAAPRRPAPPGKMSCSTESYDKLLELILDAWSPSPPRRRHTRELCSGEILVAHDWEHVRRLVKFSEMALAGRSPGYESNHAYKMSGLLATTSDYDGRMPGGPSVSARQALANLLLFEKMAEPGAVDTWRFYDTSESGLGAIAETDCAWAKIGMVIAFRERDSAEWKLALVRRLERSPNGRLFIGMARVGGKVHAARLWPGIGRVRLSATPLRKESGTELEYGGLMVRAAVSSVLLPMGLFDATQKYTISYDDHCHVVNMQRILERGLNFEQIEIAEVELQQAA